MRDGPPKFKDFPAEFGGSGEACRVGTRSRHISRPLHLCAVAMSALYRRCITDQAEQETHVAAVGSAFRRLRSIGPRHLPQVPYVPSHIRFRAVSI